ncbi:MAG: glucuronate isomerase [Clostridia bacterium]|nr:glucuronate isomerase [Clostridia bacterium]
MKQLLLHGPTASKLYASVKDLPIYDYHCHLSPREIYEDQPATDLTSLWLAGDHYKWRLMRQSGIEEKYITGDAAPKEKLRAYATAIQFAAGNPLYLWTRLELAAYFGIEDQLTPENSDEIYDRAAAAIKERSLSPRKLIEMSNVALVATTDDPADSLEWHEKIAADETFSCKVLPSYRPDKMLLCRAADYKDYLARLSASAGVAITDYASLIAAAKARLDFFVDHGCRVTDLGIPAFPASIGTPHQARVAFAKVLAGEEITDVEFDAFLSRALIDLAKLYKEHGLLAQLHLAVQRNVNPTLFATVGVDAGGDCIDDPIPATALSRLLAAMEGNDGLPATVLYTLNPSMLDAMVSVAGSFRGVQVGAAWWFMDHTGGIRRVMQSISEMGQIASFYGMLTDSRSFLSYTRHDYFRRILCTFIGQMVDAGEFAEEAALPLAEKICYLNIRNRLYPEV